MRAEKIALPTTPRPEPLSARQLLDSPVKVMLVDNRTVMREGLRMLIEQQPDLSVVAQAATVRGAGRIDVEPDVIVTEIDLPDATNGDVISGLRGFFPGTAILVLSFVAQPATVQAVLAAGTDGYLMKTATPADLLTGIRALAGGEKYLQPALGVDLARWQRRPDAALGLSQKEERVLQLVARGYTNAEVARLLGVSLRTVETHRGRIVQKLGRRTRAELVRYAGDLGLI